MTGEQPLPALVGLPEIRAAVGEAAGRAEDPLSSSDEEQPAMSAAADRAAAIPYERSLTPLQYGNRPASLCRSGCGAAW